MLVEQGKDSIWCASGNGNLRPIAAFGDTRREAMHHYTEVFLGQQGQEYAYEQAMSHLSDISGPNWTTTSGYDYEK